MGGLAVGLTEGTHRTEALGWPPPHTARCTASRPAWCIAALESGHGAGGGTVTKERREGPGRRSARARDQEKESGDVGGGDGRRLLERVAEAPPRFCHPTRCAPRPTVTRAAPQSRSSGSSRCARFTRSWTPMRIFTVSGTSSTCGAGAVSTAQGRPGGRRARRGAYLVHSSDDLLELGRAVHEGTAPALGETGGWSRGRQAGPGLPLLCRWGN